MKKIALERPFSSELSLTSKSLSVISISIQPVYTIGLCLGKVVRRQSQDKRKEAESKNALNIPQIGGKVSQKGYFKEKERVGQQLAIAGDLR